MNNRLKDLRIESGMTQEDLGNKAGVSRQTIISIESGRYDPSLSLAFKLAGLFGRKIEEVFFPEV